MMPDRLDYCSVRVTKNSYSIMFRLMGNARQILTHPLFWRIDLVTKCGETKNICLVCIAAY